MKTNWLNNRNYQYPDHNDNIRTAKIDYLNLNLEDNQQMLDFYQNQANIKYVKEIGPRGGVKHHTKKTSQELNPFLSKTDLHDSFDKASYLSKLNHHRDELNVAEDKVRGLKSRISDKQQVIKIFMFMMVAFGALSFVGIYVAILNSLTVGAILGVSGLIGAVIFIILWLIKTGDVTALQYQIKSTYDQVLDQVHFLTKNEFMQMFALQEQEKIFETESFDLNKLNALTIDDIKSNRFNNTAQGIYLYWIANPNMNYDDYFIPYYVGKANNLVSRWRQHINAIEKLYLSGIDDKELKYQKIVYYFKMNNLGLDRLRFAILEQNNTSTPWDESTLKSKETYWMKKTQSGERGFNSIK